jgi:6-phosphogluconolactonase
LEAAQQATAARGRFLLAVSGGNTPRPLYHRLAEKPYRELFPWATTHFFWADERAVAPDDEGSNYGLLQRLLLRHVPVPADHIHRMRGELGAALAANAYASALRSLAPPGAPWPRLDLAMLGLGSDGHTASIFPGSPVVTTQTAAVAASARYEDRPVERITLTAPLFNDSRQIYFLVAGAAKASAVAATLGGAYDPARWPAQRIRPADGTVSWFVDSAAATGLIDFDDIVIHEP